MKKHRYEQSSAAAAFRVVSLVLIGVSMLTSLVCMVVMYRLPKQTAPAQSGQPAVTAAPALTTAAPAVTTAAAPAGTNAQQPAADQTTPAATNPAAAPTQGGQSAAPATAPQAMTNEQIFAMLSNAINQTKAYTGHVTASHTENFEADIQSITGGSIVAGIANRLIGSVVEPTDETLDFNGGTAVNTEGETVPLLLPKAGAFTLAYSDVASISSKPNGAGTTIDVTLVPERAGLGEIPRANAAGVGYLDIGSLDISMVDIQSVDIQYEGSTIHADIDANGYVTAVTYTIPMTVNASAKVMGINGQAVFIGKETEVWTIHW